MMKGARHVSMQRAARDLGMSMSRCGACFVPRSIWCVGKNYFDHIGEVDTHMDLKMTAKGRPEHPIIFLKSSRSAVGSAVDVAAPACTEKMDYEGELAVIIGREGKDIRADDAMSYVYGFTVSNDLTARDLQKKHQQFSIGKSLEGFFPFGPDILLNETAAPLGAFPDLRVQTFVNSELRQDGRTSQMMFKIPELIELLSAGGTLYPGDVIATGTPAGVGAGMDPPEFLKAGDEVVVEIEGVGRLVSPIVGGAT